MREAATHPKTARFEAPPSLRATPSRTRVKICGITRAEDARSAARLGADAIGLVFWPGSSRYVEVERARHVVAAVPPLVAVVGVFVDAAESEIRSILDRVALDVLQFHGAETARECTRYGRRYIKAVRVREAGDVERAAAGHPEAQALLLDTYRATRPGGTGETFDWSLVPSSPPRPIVLAGGLTVDNVAGAVSSVRPFAVDVSGGVESSAGVKDTARIAAFIREVQHGGTR